MGLETHIQKRTHSRQAHKKTAKLTTGGADYLENTPGHPVWEYLRCESSPEDTSRSFLWSKTKNKIKKQLQSLNLVTRCLQLQNLRAFIYQD